MRNFSLVLTGTNILFRDYDRNEDQKGGLVARLGTGFTPDNLQGRWYIDWNSSHFPALQGQYLKGEDFRGYQSALAEKFHFVSGSGYVAVDETAFELNKTTRT